MKFFKTKAVAALSIALLLSTQAKGMGHDAELALQTPMAQASVEVIKPSLTEQAREVFSKTKNFTVDSTKSLYGVALDNKALAAGVVGLGVAGLAYKKYPKSAIATGVASAAVTATALTGKYSPATLEKGTELAVNLAKGVQAEAGLVANFAKDAGNSMLQAGKSAVNFVAVNSVEAGKAAANFVAAHTPEIVKNIPSYVEGSEAIAIMAAVGAGYGAYKAFTPAKNAVTRAAKAARPHAGKIALGTAATGAAVAAIYYNQDTIANFAKEVVNSVSNVGSAVKNADYAKYGNMAANQYGKLKVNGARLVEAARNMDVKAMAQDAGQFMKNHKVAIVGSAAGAATVATTGYIAKQVIEERREAKAVADLNKAAASVNIKVMVPMTDIGDELRNASLLKPVVTEAPKLIVYGPQPRPAQSASPLNLSLAKKPAPAKARVAALPVIEVVTNPAQVVLPGQEAA